MIRRSAFNRRRFAFTLVELLIVMGIFIALAVVTVPAFRRMTESSRLAGGMNAVRAALNTARALALERGVDVAAMFLFDPVTQTASVQFIELVADVPNGDGRSGGMIGASVFVPISGLAPIDLPRGIGVYGYGYGASTGNANPSNQWNWYADLGVLTYDEDDEYPWVFPRTDPRTFVADTDAIDNESVEHLDTFIVRFNPTGAVVTTSEHLKISWYNNARGGDGFLELDSPGDPLNGDEYLVWNPAADYGPDNDQIHAEVQFRSSPFISVIDLELLADETGIREPWHVVGDRSPFEGNGTASADADNDGTLDQIEINRWINVNADFLSFNRYTGVISPPYRK